MDKKQEDNLVQVINGLLRTSFGPRVSGNRVLKMNEKTKREIYQFTEELEFITKREDGEEKVIGQFIEADGSNLVLLPEYALEACKYAAHYQACFCTEAQVLFRNLDRVLNF